MVDLNQVADSADMIINGYAFARFEEGFRVLNLNHSDEVAVFSEKGDVLEASLEFNYSIQLI